MAVLQTMSYWAGYCLLSLANLCKRRDKSSPPSRDSLDILQTPFAIDGILFICYKRCTLTVYSGETAKFSEPTGGSIRERLDVIYQSSFFQNPFLILVEKHNHFFALDKFMLVY